MKFLTTSLALPGFDNESVPARQNRKRARRKSKQNPENPHHARRGKDMNNRVCFFIYDEDGNATSKYCYSPEKAEEIIRKMDRKEREEAARLREEAIEAEELREREERIRRREQELRRREEALQPKMKNEIPNRDTCLRMVPGAGDMGAVRYVHPRAYRQPRVETGRREDGINWPKFQTGTVGRMVQKTNGDFVFCRFNDVGTCETFVVDVRMTPRGWVNASGEQMFSTLDGRPPRFHTGEKVKTGPAQGRKVVEDDDFDMEGLTWESE